jgi:hypothetical protein
MRNQKSKNVLSGGDAATGYTEADQSENPLSGKRGTDGCWDCGHHRMNCEARSSDSWKRKLEPERRRGEDAVARSIRWEKQIPWRWLSATESDLEQAHERENPDQKPMTGGELHEGNDNGTTCALPTEVTKCSRVQQPKTRSMHTEMRMRPLARQKAEGKRWALLLRKSRSVSSITQHETHQGVEPINKSLNFFFMKTTQDLKHRGHHPPSFPHLIVGIKNRFLVHFYSNTMKMKFGSGKELHPSKILYIGPSKILNCYYAP